MRVRSLILRPVFWFGAACLLAALVVSLRFTVTSDATRTDDAGLKDSTDGSISSIQRGSPSGSSKSISANQSHAELLSHKLAAALDQIGHQSDPNNQATALQNLAKEVRITDIPTALGLSEGKFPRLSAEFRLLLIRRWTESDAPVAANWAAQNLTGPQRETALSSIAAAWAGQDFPSAENWARQLPEAEERGAVMVALAYEMNRDNPKAALTLAAELPDSAKRDEFIVQSAGAWGAHAFKESVEWAGQIPDESLRHRVLGAIAAAVAESNPSAAATLAVESLPSGREQDDAVVGIVQRWVQKSPEEAAAWVAAFPEGNLRETALDALVKLWADKDLLGAGTFVDTLTSRASRDIAVAAYVEKLAVQFPEMAIEWSREIHNEQLRGERLENLAELWLHTDAAAAREWIADAPLSAAAKSRLLALGSK